jgi:Lrp/AsnC family leucine-responsive transcriptional regulator
MARHHNNGTGGTGASGTPARHDDINQRLIAALSRDGRRAAADLAKELGLSRQAVTERMRLLEETGLIRGYHADVAPAHLGLGVRAVIRLQVDATTGRERDNALRRTLAANPYVRTVHHVSGEDCYVVDVVCRQITDVHALLSDLKATRALQSSRTAFVLETVLDRTTFGVVPEALLDDDSHASATTPHTRRPAPRRAARRGSAR